MTRFIVLRGTRPQSRKLCVRAGLRSAVLVDGEPVTVFADRRQARRAIARTRDAVETLGSRSLHRDWMKDRPEFASLFSPEPFTIVPVEFLTRSGAVAIEVAALVPSSADDGILNGGAAGVAVSAQLPAVSGGPVTYTECGRSSPAEKAESFLFDLPLVAQPGQSLAIQLP